MKSYFQRVAQYVPDEVEGHNNENDCHPRRIVDFGTSPEGADDTAGPYAATAGASTNTAIVSLLSAGAPEASDIRSRRGTRRNSASASAKAGVPLAG